MTLLPPKNRGTSIIYQEREKIKKIKHLENLKKHRQTLKNAKSADENNVRKNATEESKMPDPS